MILSVFFQVQEILAIWQTERFGNLLLVKSSIHYIFTDIPMFQRNLNIKDDTGHNCTFLVKVADEGVHGLRMLCSPKEVRNLFPGPNKY